MERNSVQSEISVHSGSCHRWTIWREVQWFSMLLDFLCAVIELKVWMPAIFPYLSNWNCSSWSRTCLMLYHQHHSWQHSAVRDAAGLALKSDKRQQWGGNWGRQRAGTVCCPTDLPKGNLGRTSSLLEWTGSSRWNMGLWGWVLPVCCLYEDEMLSLYIACLLSPLITCFLYCTSKCICRNRLVAYQWHWGIALNFPRF